MSWTAPPLRHLLESRLRDARLELFADGRLGDLQHDEDTPEFANALIEKKLAAAAANGLDAVEASLRLSASEALNAKGVDPEVSRAGLRTAGERLRKNAPTTGEAGIWTPAPLHVTAALYLLGGFLGAAIGESKDVPVWTHVLILLGALLGALVVYQVYTRQLQRVARQHKNELPARVCRQYIEQFDRALAEYEETVRSLLSQAAKEDS